MEKNVKSWLFSGLGAFVVIFVLDFLTHGVLLKGPYEATASVWRPQEEMMSMNWMMMVGQLLFALALACFYTKGYEADKNGLQQGLRFGSYAGILLATSQSFVWYVVLPVPFSLNLAWIVSSFVNCVAAGAVIGLIYKSK